MKSPRFFRIFTIILICFVMSLQSIEAQNVKTQRQIDEKLARDFYYKKDYEKARDIYKNLYDTYGSVNHFTQYAECLILIGDYVDLFQQSLIFLPEIPVFLFQPGHLVLHHHIFPVDGQDQDHSSDQHHAENDIQGAGQHFLYGIAHGLNPFRRPHRADRPFGVVIPGGTSGTRRWS